MWPILCNNNFKKLLLWDHWLDFIIIISEIILRWHSLRIVKNVMKTWKTWPPGGVARFIQWNFENLPLKTSYKFNISRNFFLWSLISPMTSGERLRAAWPSCYSLSLFNWLILTSDYLIRINIVFDGRGLRYCLQYDICLFLLQFNFYVIIMI